MNNSTEYENISYEFNDEVTKMYSLHFRYGDVLLDNEEVSNIIDYAINEFSELEKLGVCSIVEAADCFYIIDTKNDNVADMLEEICSKCEELIDDIYDELKEQEELEEAL